MPSMPSMPCWSSLELDLSCPKVFVASELKNFYLLAAAQFQQPGRWLIDNVEAAVCGGRDGGHRGTFVTVMQHSYRRDVKAPLS